MWENTFREIALIPEHCITLHAPAFIIRKYLRFYLYSFLYGREILNDGSYVQELFEGRPMNIPQDTASRSYIESYIADILANLQNNKTYACCLFIYVRESSRMVERWIFKINTKYDVRRNAVPTLNDLMVEMAVKVTLLPRLGVPCIFRAYLIK